MKKLFFLFISAFCLLSSAFGQNTAGDSLFYSPNIHTVKLYFSQVGWWDSLVYYKPLDFKMLAAVEIDGNYIDSIGVQFKGNSSYNAPGVKKPFKIDFNEYVSGQSYDGLKTINLNNCMGDPTLMREKLFLDFCHAAGIPAPRATYANLYLNDTLWGIYTLVEQVNKTFLENRYFNDAGNLFKGDNNGTLQWYGTSQASYYGKYELKTNETANDWTDLVHLIDKINNTDSLSFYDSLEAVLNTTAWIKGWAANNIFVNLDSYIGTGHNYYVYHNTATNLFDFIIWDCNETFGKFSFGMTISQLENLTMFYLPAPPAVRPLHKRMLQNPTYHSVYVSTVCNLVRDYFTHACFDPKIDSIANRIRADVHADPHKPYTNQNFETNINQPVGNAPGLKSFITNRGNSLGAQLAANGCWVGVEEAENVEDEIYVFPNPAEYQISVQSLKFKVKSVEVFDVMGKKINPIVVSGQLSAATPRLSTDNYQLTIDVSKLVPGIYFVKVKTEAGESIAKFVKQ
ncbi:MAG TPA: CotH kinase family protein [Bacteroidia bacterium]|nr:CotH kinase family protein [Bacteroidia bacterium]